MTSPFRTARPVWPEGRATEMNLHVGFRAVLAEAPRQPVLYVTASSAYRAYVNGAFVGHGPARAPHGEFRVDSWDLSPWLGEGPALVAVEAVGYNVNSYYLLDQPAFLLAEVCAGEEVLASTAGEGVPFEALIPTDHVQRVERYSVARTYSEAFRLHPEVYRWRTDPEASFEPVPCEVGALPTLLPRRVPYPDLRTVEPLRAVASGRLAEGAPLAEPYRDWTLTGLGPDLKGYPEEAFEVAPSLRWQAVRTTAYEPSDAPVAFPLGLPEGAFTILDFGVNQTGSIGLEVRCEGPARLYVLFDEILTEGDVDPRRLRCLNILDCALEPGAHAFETFEPYTLRYLKLAVLEGACRVERVALRTFANPEAAEASFASGDPDLDLLFEAGRETLRQNALDLLMDCPSRERAGWPCDSFFTARATALLTGSTAVERAFLENYARAPHLPSLPEGMLPMNYPADHPNGDFLGARTAQFIPNWPLWLVIQLEEYLHRSGDREMVEAFEEKVRALSAYFARFRNETGLLEDLEGWVFVEWSKANEFVAGVNYPTNMLYAATLDAAGRLYGEPAWQEEAARLRETIAREAFDGRFFVDQALRQGGELVRTDHRTETCQYYAFYYGVASPETHGALWENLRTAFGPGRDPETSYPEVHPAAMLNGYYLRLELLERYGYGREVVEEALAYFLPMARTTGTLWEHAGPLASCCHGFASHVAVTLCRHVFGLDRVDPVGRVVHLREGLPGITGDLRLPLGEGTLVLDRQGEGSPALTLPEGYRVRTPPLVEGARQ